jgi:hypothetical protein
VFNYVRLVRDAPVEAVAQAPTIDTQPESLAVNEGADASFAVVASGTAPLSYQWQKDGTDIEGATSATHAIASVVSGDEGDYRCVVTNSAGSATSDIATLTVHTPPSITTQPESQTARQYTTVSFSVVASGTAPLSYQWQKDGTDIEGATAATYWLDAYSASDAGDYRCIVTNDLGSATSDAATLTLRLGANVTTDPSNQTVAEGDDATFTVVAIGEAPITYQWQKYEGTTVSDIDGATSSSYTIASVTSADAARYRCIVSNSIATNSSSWGRLIVLTAPSITTQPVDQTANLGDEVTFTVVASGSETLSYQWQKDGADIEGATGATYTFSASSASDAGNYRCVVTNPVGSATSDAATLTIGTPPTIDTQPTSQTVGLGGAVTFTVSASGTETLTYQWQKDGADIGGATSASHAIDPVSQDDAGDYRCVVTNDVGSAASTAATLTVDASMWTMAIRVTNGSPQSLVMGVNPAATEGVDDYDEAVPPDPQGGVGTAKFVLLGGGEELSQDMREALPGSEWWIYVDGTASTLQTTLSWSGQVFASENVRLQLLTSNDMASAEIVYGSRMEPMGSVSVGAGKALWVVIDENEAPTLASATFTVDEDSEEGTTVGTVSGTDSNDVEVLTYAITGGNSDGLFTIDAASGAITLAEDAELDYETTDSHALTVTVTDNGGLSDTATVTIEVGDVDEAPVIAAATFALAEDSSIDTCVGVLSASDPEGGTVTYSITSGNTGGAFRIEANTPTIYVDDAIALDYETTPKYILTVSGEDAAGNIGTGWVTINITDANDAPTLTDTSFAVAEDCANDTVLGMVIGNDQDGDALVYEITAGNDDGVFAIDSNTGAFGVIGNSGLDYAATPEYSLTVRVTDGDGATGTGTVTVHACDGWVVTMLAAETTESAQFGVTSGATVAFDDGLDANAAAASPQIAIYPQALDRGVWLCRELQGSASGCRWEMRVYGGTDGLTLTWDAVALPEVGLQLEEIYYEENYRSSRGAVTEAVIDMSATTSLYIAPQTTRHLVITPILDEFSIDLWQGWNLISLPIEPADPALESVLAEVDCRGSVWLWDTTQDSGKGAYAEAVELHALTGYWVYVGSAGTLTVAGSEPTNTVLDLAAGWNLIGVADHVTLQENAALIMPFWHWTNTLRYGNTLVGDTLLPGYGYWARATEATTLNAGSTSR